MGNSDSKDQGEYSKKFGNPENYEKKDNPKTNIFDSISAIYEEIAKINITQELDKLEVEEEKLLKDRINDKNENLLQFYGFDSNVSSDVFCGSSQNNTFFYFEYPVCTLKQEIEYRLKRYKNEKIQSEKPIPYTDLELWGIFYSLVKGLIAIQKKGGGKQCRNMSTSSIYINAKGYYQICELGLIKRLSIQQADIINIGGSEIDKKDNKQKLQSTNQLIIIKNGQLENENEPFLSDIYWLAIVILQIAYLEDLDDIYGFVGDNFGFNKDELKKKIQNIEIKYDKGLVDLLNKMTEVEDKRIHLHSLFKEIETHYLKALNKQTQSEIKNENPAKINEKQTEIKECRIHQSQQIQQLINVYRFNRNEKNAYQDSAEIDLRQVPIDNKYKQGQLGSSQQISQSRLQVSQNPQKETLQQQNSEHKKIFKENNRSIQNIKQPSAVDLSNSQSPSKQVHFQDSNQGQISQSNIAQSQRPMEVSQMSYSNNMQRPGNSNYENSNNQFMQSNVFSYNPNKIQQVHSNSNSQSNYEKFEEIDDDDDFINNSNSNYNQNYNYIKNQENNFVNQFGQQIQQQNPVIFNSGESNHQNRLDQSSRNNLNYSGQISQNQINSQHVPPYDSNQQFQTNQVNRLENPEFNNVSPYKQQPMHYTNDPKQIKQNSQILHSYQDNYQNNKYQIKSSPQLPHSYRDQNNNNNIFQTQQQTKQQPHSQSKLQDSQDQHYNNIQYPTQQYPSQLTNSQQQAQDLQGQPYQHLQSQQNPQISSTIKKNTDNSQEQQYYHNTQQQTQYNPLFTNNSYQSPQYAELFNSRQSNQNSSQSPQKYNLNRYDQRFNKDNITTDRYVQFNDLFLDSASQNQQKYNAQPKSYNLKELKQAVPDASISGFTLRTNRNKLIGHQSGKKW